MMATTTAHADHGVKPFDPDLQAGRYDAIARGAFRVLRTDHGRFYAVVRLETKLGHLCAAVHLERAAASGLLSVTGAETAPALGAVTSAADAAATELEAAAQERGTAPPVLRAARVCVRAHMGDEQARDFVRRTLRAAHAGDPRARKAVRVLATGRAFAHEVLGHQTTTGSFFDDIGHAISHAVRDVSHAVQHVTHDVMQAERSVEKAVGPVVKAIKQWGPMILSDVQGLVSLIPGIGQGISAAIAAAEAILSGGGPLEIAIHLAYGAIPIPPGIRNITDMVLDSVMEFVRNPHHLEDAAIAAIRDRIPKGLPQEIFDTLIRIVVKRQPILKVAGDLAGHYVNQYTNGLASSLTKGLAPLSDSVKGILSKLPDPKIAFKSIHDIAPHFAISPHLVPTLLAHAQRAANVPLDPRLAAKIHEQVARAVVTHAHQSAALRVAHNAHVAPRLVGPGPTASLAIEISPDGAQHRVVASASLAHLIPTLHL